MAHWISSVSVFLVLSKPCWRDSGTGLEKTVLHLRLPGSAAQQCRMLTQAMNQAGSVWQPVKQPGRGTVCPGAKMACTEAAQAPGCSPSSEASSGMEYSCSMPATPAAKEQLNSGADAPAITFEGWFAKCRGCGCMTAHEKLIKDSDVPFCRRCQHTLTIACPAMQQKMVDTLLYVHHAWSNAGL